MERAAPRDTAAARNPSRSAHARRRHRAPALPAPRPPCGPPRPGSAGRRRAHACDTRATISVRPAAPPRPARRPARLVAPRRCRCRHGAWDGRPSHPPPKPSSARLTAEGGTAPTAIVGWPGSQPRRHLRPGDPWSGAARAPRTRRRAALPPRRHRDRRPPRPPPFAALDARRPVLTALITLCNFLTYGATAMRPARRAQETRPASSPPRRCGRRPASALTLVALTVAFARPRSTCSAARRLHRAARALCASAPSVLRALIALAGQGYLRGVADLRTPLDGRRRRQRANVVLELVSSTGWAGGCTAPRGTVMAQAGMGAAFCGCCCAPRRAPGVRDTSRPLRAARPHRAATCSFGPASLLGVPGRLRRRTRGSATRRSETHQIGFSSSCSSRSSRRGRHRRAR